MAEGKTVVTLNGLKALTEASTLGKQVKPTLFKVSDQDVGDIYPGIDVDDLPGVWLTDSISAYVPVNDSTVQFILDIPADKATKFGRTFGLYLEDGTLFAVAKPPYPFPPLMRQRFKIQFVWEQIESVMNFEDIPFYEFDQDMTQLDVVSTISLALFDVQEHLTVLEQFKADYYRFRDSTSEKIDSLSVRLNALASSFNNSLSESGYQKLPGGVILQWLTTTVNDGHGIVSLPVPFPNRGLCVIATDVGWGTHSIGVSFKDNQSVEVWTYDPQNNQKPPATTLHVIAIGF